MLSTRKIIRAFLASPGDLEEERKAIREVVDEFNNSWANALGYQFELVGWEETVAGFGRPQHIINQDLDRCDLFLGMMWKRWGTPPDNEGKFSSGFQEEFERSMARCEKTGSPEISLLFKQIPKEFMQDPGDDLKKVLEFRETIITGKKILFQNFSTVHDIEVLARKCVTAYVNRIRAEDESSESDELQTKRARSDPDKVREDDSGSESSPLSAEGFKFLESLVERISRPDSVDSLSAIDVARFRLLSNLISKPGNEKLQLGVHDINILFKARTEGTVLGDKEIRVLARLGLQHLANENVPLWCWYSDLKDMRISFPIISSIVGDNENEKVGAISVLTSLAHDLPSDNDSIKRDQIINYWFSDDSSTIVRTAALGYLSKCGTANDLEYAKKEYDRSEHGTSRSALECMVAILLRTGQLKAAQELVIESQFESLNTNLLRSVLEGFEGVDTPTLLLGLEHRNPNVRLRAMVVLNSREELNIAMTERLSGDSDALIRNEAIATLRKLGKPLAEKEIKKILVPPPKQSGVSGLGLRSYLGSDKLGEELFHQYQLDVFKGLSKAELEKKVKENHLHDDTPYFALAEKYFKKHADELRSDVDDRFDSYFEERTRRMKVLFKDSSIAHDLVKQTKDLKEYYCKKLTRKGLDVLCAAQMPEDLQRIRANIRESYTALSKLDVVYLTKHGEWVDIPLLANAEGQKVGRSLLTISSDDDFQLEVARAIISIGKKHSISDLLSLEMPSTILKMTIELCAESRFAKISQDALLTLFYNESEGVRKAAAVMTVRSLPMKRIKSILSKYIEGDKYRFYNVIHWLDLGASMRRVDAKKVALAANS